MRLLGLDRRDLRFFALTAGIAFAAVTALYATAYLSAPPGYAFYGQLHNSHDGYNAMVLCNYEAHQGPLVDSAWALQKRPGAFFNLLYYLEGLVMRLGVPYNVVFHATQALGGLAMFLGILALMRMLLRDRVMAWSAYLLASFATGFGWLEAIVSPDFMRGEFFTGDIILGGSFPIAAFWSTPHLAVSTALLVFIYYCAYRAATVERWWPWAAGAAALTLAIGYIHPYQLIAIGLVLGCWHLALWAKHGKPFLPRLAILPLLFACMLPGALFFKTLPTRSPNFAFYANIPNSSTSWLCVVLGFGLLMVLAPFSFRGLVPLRRFTDRYLFVAVWLLVNFTLHLSGPIVPWDGKLGEGVIMPLAVFAVWTFFGHVLPLLRRGAADPSPDADVLAEAAGQPVPAAEGAAASDRARLAWVAGLLVLCLPTTGLQWSNFLQELRTGRARYTYTLNTKMVIPKPELEALRFLGKNVRGFPLVIAGPECGLLLPAFAQVRSFAGFVIVTRDRYGVAAEFYRTSDERRRELTRQFGFEYVWWGADEDRYGVRRPANLPWLQPVFNNGYVTIYRVDRSAL